MKFKFFISALIAVAVLSSCENNNNTNNNPADVTIHLEHVFGANAFALNSATPYVNGSNDSVTFTTLKYYISNVVFQKSGGGTFVEPESYHLVDLSASSSTEVHIHNVEAGEYSGVTFLLGVDSTRNVSGAQTGALDPANNMFWSWSTGYIFLKAEGTSPQSPSGFTYHLGGFTGANSALQVVNISFGGDNLIVNTTNQNESHFVVDVKQMFDGPNAISVSTLSNVTMPGANAHSIAVNCGGMFDFEHNHN